MTLVSPRHANPDFPIAIAKFLYIILWGDFSLFNKFNPYLTVSTEVYSG
jgi:hypothetical protein